MIKWLIITMQKCRRRFNRKMLWYVNF